MLPDQPATPPAPANPDQADPSPHAAATASQASLPAPPVERRWLARLREVALFLVSSFLICIGLIVAVVSWFAGGPGLFTSAKFLSIFSLACCAAVLYFFRSRKKSATPTAVVMLFGLGLAGLFVVIAVVVVVMVVIGVIMSMLTNPGHSYTR